MKMEETVSVQEPAAILTVKPEVPHQLFLLCYWDAFFPYQSFFFFGDSGFLPAVWTGCSVGKSLGSCSDIRARGMWKGTFPVTTTLCLKTDLQALVGHLLHHPQTWWIPWSASRGARGASEKLFWCLTQANTPLFHLGDLQNSMGWGSRMGLESSRDSTCKCGFSCDQVLLCWWKSEGSSHTNIKCSWTVQCLAASTCTGAGGRGVFSICSAPWHRCCNLVTWAVSDGPGFLSCSVQGKLVCLSAENHVLFVKHVHCFIKPNLEGVLLPLHLLR